MQLQKRGRSLVQILGLDIGGANIKAATADGLCIHQTFALWKHPELLSRQIEEIVVGLQQPPALVALTMTGELADCFETRAQGVEVITQAVCSVFNQIPVRVWLTSGEFAAPDEALDLSELVAAANWHALATWAGRAVPEGPALLIDCGSTTTDLIPLLDGIPDSSGRTDLQRLQAGELLYRGVRRTPVCAMISEVPLPFNGRESAAKVPVAGEIFATALDVHLLCGELPEIPADTDTADGRPCTRDAAIRRLARQICTDLDEVDEQTVIAVARHIHSLQVDELAAAILQICSHAPLDGPPRPTLPLILSGSGDWLIRKAIAKLQYSSQFDVLPISEMFRTNVSSCAPAFAVARLAAERCSDEMIQAVPPGLFG
jgi:probable H4MPT-linked C1 transfer pathway protein